MKIWKWRPWRINPREGKNIPHNSSHLIEKLKSPLQHFSLDFVPNFLPSHSSAILVHQSWNICPDSRNDSASPFVLHITCHPIRNIRIYEQKKKNQKIDFYQLSVFSWAKNTQCIFPQFCHVLNSSTCIYIHLFFLNTSQLKTIPHSFFIFNPQYYEI